MKTNHAYSGSNLTLKTSPSFSPHRTICITKCAALAIVGLLLASTPTLASSLIWNGAASPSLNWSAGGNWVGGGAPAVSGDDVVFVNAAGNPLISTVDSAISVNGITRNGNDGTTVMTINTLGNLTLNGDVIATTGGLTLAGPMTLAKNINVWRTVAGSSGNLIFTNAPGDTAGISGGHSVTFSNILGGTFFIYCNNPLSTWSGGANVKYGNVRLNNVSSSGLPGAPTAGPLGTGTVTLGSAGEVSQAIISWVGAASQSLHNNLVVTADDGVTTTDTRRIANNLTAPLKLTLSGSVSAGDDLFMAGTANNVTRLDGAVGGSGTLVVNAAGLNALLMGNNSHAGGMRVIGGANLGFGSDTALGSGTVFFGEAVGAGQIFSYAVNGPRTVANDITIRTTRYIVGAGTIDGLAGNDQTFNGTVTMDHGSVNVRDIVLQKNLTINGELKGSIPDNNALRVIGGGKITLTGVNSYPGGTFIDSATVNINSDAALGADPGSPTVNLTFSGAGGTLQAGASSVSLSANRNISIGAGVPLTIDTLGNSLTINGVMSGGGNFTKLGAGTLTLTGTGNVINGYAFLDGNVVVDGGSFYNGAEFIVGNTAASTMTVNGVSGAAQAVTVRPGANGTFNLNGGTVTTDQIFALVPTSANTVVNFDGGTVKPWGVQPSRFSAFIADLTHAYLKTSGVTIDTVGNTLTIPQALEHSPVLGVTPDGGLTKAGTGDLYLTGTNTYTGPTTVNNGRLIVTTTGGAKGGYTVADNAAARVTITRAGTTLTNTSLTLGLFGATVLEIDCNNLGRPNVPPISVTGALEANATAYLSLKNLLLSATGVVPLIKYGSLAGVGFDSLFLVPIPNVTATLSNDTVHAVIYLVISDVNYPKWKGNLSSDWDIGFTANWVGVPSGAPTLYEEPSIPGPPVLFDDTADTGLVNLTTTLSPYSLTVSNNSLNYTLSGGGSLSGPGGLTKNGSAQLTLEAANSFSGPVTVNAGTVLASAVNALGSGGALTVNNATVNISDYNQSVGAVALTNGNILGTNGVLTASGYTLASGTVSAHLVNGNLTKTGSGTVSLTASNNIGATTIDGGVLRVTDPNALGLGGFSAATLTAINAGGALLYDGTITTDEHLWLAGAGPDGLGALRATNGTVVIAQHAHMPTNATINVGTGATLIRGGDIYTVVTNLLTLTKRGAGVYWEYGNSSAYIPLDVVEGTFKVGGGGGTVGGSVTVRSNATLTGVGVINGAVTVQPGGTLSPGAAIGALTIMTINNNLTLQGTNLMQIAKNSGVTANDQVKGIITLTAGGTLVVTNLGTDALAAGDTFPLFIAATKNVAFAAVTLPALNPGLAWVNNLAVNGSIQVVSTAPQFGGVARLNDGNIQLTGTGPTNAAYRIFAATNVALPFSNWLQVGTGTFTGGVLSFTDLQATNYARRFYRAVTP